MNVSDHFDDSKGEVCPVCGTAKDAPSCIVKVSPDREGQVHLSCYQKRVQEMKKDEERAIKFQEGMGRNLQGILEALTGVRDTMDKAEASAEGLEDTLPKKRRKKQVKVAPTAPERAIVIQKGEVDDVKLFAELGVDEFIRRML